MTRPYDVVDSVVGLAATLRSSGVAATADRVHAAVAALALLDATRRADVYWASRLTLCGSPDELARFDDVFNAYFGDRPGSVVRRQRLSRPQLQLVASDDAPGQPDGPDGPQRENATAAAHRMAADLIEAGVDTHGVYRRLFEDLPFPRLELLTRALQGVARHDDGAITMAMLTRSDYEQTGALETDSEGVVDHLRAVEGTKVAVLVRELLADDRRGRRKVSLRATDGKVDVSLIARNLGGGGHRQAAGFTTELTPDQLVTVLRELVAAQLRAG